MLTAILRRCLPTILLLGGASALLLVVGKCFFLVVVLDVEALCAARVPLFLLEHGPRVHALLPRSRNAAAGAPLTLPFRRSVCS